MNIYVGQLITQIELACQTSAILLFLATVVARALLALSEVVGPETSFTA